MKDHVLQPHLTLGFHQVLLMSPNENRPNRLADGLSEGCANGSTNPARCSCNDEKSGSSFHSDCFEMYVRVSDLYNPLTVHKK